MSADEVPTGMNNVLQLLAGVQYGALVEDGNEHLKDVLAALEKRGGKGTVNFKLELERDPDSPRIEVAGAVTSTVPKGAKRNHTLYLGKNGLTRQDPKQPELPMTMQEQDEAAQEQHMREMAGLG